MGVMESELKIWLQARVSDGRYQHSVGVLETVTALARFHEVDDAPLRLAALLHDCAREYSNEDLVAHAEEWGIEVRSVDRQSPVLLHGKLAVIIAERELGLSEPAMVSAVRWHTAGHPQMTLSDKLFYLADVLEPTRPEGWVLELRAIAHEDVDRAVLTAIDINVGHLNRTGRTVDPVTYLFRDLLLRADSTG